MGAVRPLLGFPEEWDGQIKPGDDIATLRELKGIPARATPGVQQPCARGNPILGKERGDARTVLGGRARDEDITKCRSKIRDQTDTSADTAAHAGGGKGRCLCLYFLRSRWCFGTAGVGADVGGHVVGSPGDVQWSMRHRHPSASRTPGRPSEEGPEHDPLRRVVQ